MDVDNYLEHYGVKGMKWGVRNDPGRGVRKSAKKGVVSVDKKGNPLSPRQTKKAIKSGKTPQWDKLKVGTVKDGKVTLAPVKKIKKNEVVYDKKNRDKIWEDFHKKVKSGEYLKISQEAFDKKLDTLDFAGETVREFEDLQKSFKSLYGIKDIPLAAVIDPKTYKSRIALTHGGVGDDFLEHYGVKGMKWGVRNDPGQGVRQKEPRKVRKARKTGDFSKLSKDQLETITARLKKESEARQALSSDPKTLARKLKAERKTSRRDAKQKKASSKSQQKSQKSSSPKKKGIVRRGTKKAAILPFTLLAMTGRKVMKVGSSKAAAEISKRYLNPKVSDAFDKVEDIFKKAGGTNIGDVGNAAKGATSNVPPPSEWKLNDILELPQGPIDLEYDDENGVWR